MTVSDGYGDNLSIPEVVSRYERWSHSVAGSMVNPHGLLYDDLVQEALIEIWRVLEKKGGKAQVSATYLTQAARYRMMNIAQGKPMIGGDTRPGPRSRPVEVQVDWNVVAENDDGSTWGRLLEAADLLSGVEWAYHQGEISEALSALSPENQDYVRQRFWHGKTDTEIAAERGLKQAAVSNRWNRKIKPHLRQALAHLGAS